MIMNNVLLSSMDQMTDGQLHEEAIRTAAEDIAQEALEMMGINVKSSYVTVHDVRRAAVCAALIAMESPMEDNGDIERSHSG